MGSLWLAEGLQMMMLLRVLSLSMGCGLAAGAAHADALRAYAGVVAGNAQVGGSGPFSCATSGPTIGNGWFAGLVLPTEGIAACGLVGATDDKAGAAGPLSSSFSASGAMAGGVGTFNGTAQARADYWSLGVAMSGTATGPTSTFTYHQAASFASFTQAVTLSKPGIATGTPGSVDFAFLIEGLASSMAVAPFTQQMDLGLGLRVNGAFIWDLFRATLINNELPSVRGGGLGLPGGFVLGPGSLSGSAMATSTANFGITWGVPFTLEVAFIGSASPCCNGSAQQADFLNTARLAGILATAGGAAVSDFTVLTESGPPVGPAGVVPEPAPWALLLAGLAGLVRVRRR